MTSFTWKTSMAHDTYRWCHGGKGNCRKATAMKKKLMRTGRRMAKAHKGWPAWKSFPDKKRSENVSTVGKIAPKTTIWPRRTTSDAFIIFCFNTKTFFVRLSLSKNLVQRVSNAQQRLKLQLNWHPQDVNRRYLTNPRNELNLVIIFKTKNWQFKKDIFQCNVNTATNIHRLLTGRYTWLKTSFGESCIS